MSVRTLYKMWNWSHQIQHGAVWGNQEVSLTGVYSVPPSLEIGNHVLKGTLKRTPPSGSDYRHLVSILLVNASWAGGTEFGAGILHSVPS